MKFFIVPLTFLWLGLVLGISLIEAPLKFQAPGITTELGLGIGKLVFTALNRVELLLAILIVIGLLKTKLVSKVNGFYTGAILLLLIQTFIFLPALNQRAELIISGGNPPESMLHIGFIALEGIKIICLVTAGLFFHKQLYRRSDDLNSAEELKIE